MSVTASFCGRWSTRQLWVARRKRLGQAHPHDEEVVVQVQQGVANVVEVDNLALDREAAGQGR